MHRTFLESKIMRVGSATILQYRPRKYVLLNNGHFEKKLSEQELAKMILIEHFGEIDVGEIELAVAVGAISVIFTTIKIDTSSLLASGDAQVISIFIHVLAFVSFIASSYSAGRLYYTFLLQKFPNIFLKIGLNVGRIPNYYLGLWKKMFLSSAKRIYGDISRTENEIGYLSLLAAFSVVILLSVFVLVFSLAQEISHV